MQPTLEEVKNHFKNAKIVKCLSSNKKRDLTELDITRGVHLFIGCYWVDYTNSKGKSNSVKLWKYGYAEIIEYKQQETMNKELIDKLTKGKIAVINDGSLEELIEVLKEAFPKDSSSIHGTHDFYYNINSVYTGWACSDCKPANLPTLSVKNFFKTEESKEDKLDRLQKELDTLRQSIKEDKEFKVGDVVVVLDGCCYEGKVTKIREPNPDFKPSSGSDVTIDIAHNTGGGFNISKSSLRKATIEETEKFYEKIELPIIEGYTGKDKGKYIEFGCQTFHRSDLEVLGKLGITSFNLIVGGDKIRVSKAQTKQLKTYLIES